MYGKSHYLSGRGPACFVKREAAAKMSTDVGIVILPLLISNLLCTSVHLTSSQDSAGGSQSPLHTYTLTSLFAQRST